MKNNSKSAILFTTKSGQTILASGPRKFLMSCLYDVESAKNSIDETYLEDRRVKPSKIVITKDFLEKRRVKLQKQRKK